MHRFLLAPIAIIYWLAVSVRNMLFDMGIIRSREFGIPTICVGNLTVGGTGKTPHIEFLVKHLALEHSVATLSRGYGRKSKGFRIVEYDSKASEVGDEPLQIKRRYPHITVAVCESRVKGVEALLKLHPKLGVILLDDAFQHRHLKAGLNILLTDYGNLITRDYFLPVGTLRDSVAELHRADCVVVTKCPPTIKPIDQRIVIKELRLKPYQSIFFTTMVYGKPLSVFQGARDIISYNETKVFALAGIANPKPFIEHLSSCVSLAGSMVLPDHAIYSKKRVDELTRRFRAIPEERKVIFTTEKDAARIRELSWLNDDIRQALYYIPIEVKFVGDTHSKFLTNALKYVGKSKWNRIVHKEQG